MNDPLIADAEYDKLYKLLEKAEAADPSIITVDSPTQRVGAGFTKQFNTTQHLVPMLSLENSYDAEEFIGLGQKSKRICPDSMSCLIVLNRNLMVQVFHWYMKTIFLPEGQQEAMALQAKILPSTLNKSNPSRFLHHFQNTEFNKWKSGVKY